MKKPTVEGFVKRFGFPGTPAGERMEKALIALIESERQALSPRAGA